MKKQWNDDDIKKLRDAMLSATHNIHTPIDWFYVGSQESAESLGVSEPGHYYWNSILNCYEHREPED